VAFEPLSSVGTANFSTRKESELLLAGSGKETKVRDEVILLAEDDADVAELFVVVLGRSGFTTISFTNTTTSTSIVL
jgi:hypothetical protein